MTSPVSPAVAERSAPSGLPVTSRSEGVRTRVAGLPARWWPVLVPTVIVLLGAWHYRWVDEDAFINFRLIDNLLAGHGLVFNVGERVEVDSDPLWLFSLVALHGVLPFMRLEWLSVLFGLVCTGGGFLAGGRAVQQLMASREGGATVLPVGLLIVSVVAGVWEFATSGLEMSMVFLWIGVAYLLLVRLELRGRGRWVGAVVIGLGTLIRPELVLMSIVLLAALLWLVIRRPDAAGRRVIRSLGLVGAAVALPVLFELFRMGYYAMVVPNTALAKAGGAAWWSQGFTYLWNFVSPYTLWVPLALAVPLVALPLRRWWGRGDRSGVVLLLVPLAAGAVDALYVVHLGGDYMHARLLLPAFFAGCLPIAVPLRRATSAVMAVCLAGIAAWAVVCVGWLRYVEPPVTSLNPQTVFISNERNSWITATRNPHPVTAADYTRALSGQAGPALARTAARVPPGRQEMLVITNPYAALSAAPRLPARSPLPFTLAINLPAIGVIGYLAGPRLYVFDAYSLANPIGSHTVITHHARPGHEKFIGPEWMVGRFGVPGSALAGLPPAEVASARRALGCAPLSSYLQAITEPLSASRFFSNMAHSFSFTRFSFSADPHRAAAELCRGSS